MSDTDKLIGFAKGLKLNNDEFLSFIKNTSYSEKTLENYQQYLSKASSANAKFTASLKNVAANMGIMLAVNLVIKAAITIWDKLNVTAAEVQEKIDDLTSSLNDLNAEFETLNSRDPESLSQSEKDRLQYLEDRIEKEERLKIRVAIITMKIFGISTHRKDTKYCSMQSLGCCSNFLCVCRMAIWTFNYWSI